MSRIRCARRILLVALTMMVTGLTIHQQAEAQWMYAGRGLPGVGYKSGDEGRRRTATSDAGRFSRSTNDRRMGVYSTGGAGIVPGGYGYYRPYTRPFRSDVGLR